MSLLPIKSNNLFFDPMLSAATKTFNNQQPHFNPYDIKKPDTYRLFDPLFIRDLQSDPQKLIKAFNRVQKLPQDLQPLKQGFDNFFLPKLREYYRKLPDFLWLKTSLLFLEKFDVSPEVFETKLKTFIQTSCENPHAFTKKELTKLHKYLKKLCTEPKYQELLPFIQQTLESKDGKKIDVAPLLWLAHCPQPFLFQTFFGGTKKAVSFSELQLIFLNGFFENNPIISLPYPALASLYEEVIHLENKDLNLHIIGLLRAALINAPINTKILDFAIPHGLTDLVIGYTALIHDKHNLHIYTEYTDKTISLMVDLNQTNEKQYSIIKDFSDYISSFTISSFTALEGLLHYYKDTPPLFENVTKLILKVPCNNEVYKLLPKVFPNAQLVRINSDRIEFPHLAETWQGVTFIREQSKEHASDFGFCNKNIQTLPNVTIAFNTAQNKAEIILPQNKMFVLESGSLSMQLIGTTKGDVVPIDDEVFFYLAERCDIPSTISLPRTQITDRSIQRITNNSYLTYLDLRQCMNLTSESWKIIGEKCKHLGQLLIQGCNISAEEVKKLKEALPLCKIFSSHGFL